MSLTFKTRNLNDDSKLIFELYTKFVLSGRQNQVVTISFKDGSNKLVRVIGATIDYKRGKFVGCILAWNTEETDKTTYNLSDVLKVE